MNVYITLFALGAYLLGAIPTGLVLARLFSATDIRARGSGNIGATNVTRLLGRKFGVLTLLGDMLKGFLPVYTGSLLFPDATGGTDYMTPQPLRPCSISGAFVSGVSQIQRRQRRCNRFRSFCLACAGSAGAGAGAVCHHCWRFHDMCPSAPSARPVVLPLLLITYSYPLPVVVTGIVMGLLVFIKHKENIQRLLQGTENKQGAS